jgi:hypothetical protein
MVNPMSNWLIPPEVLSLYMNKPMENKHAKAASPPPREPFAQVNCDRRLLNLSHV